MKESNYISPLIKFSLREPEKEDRKISYSQYAMYAKCPKQWELAYAHGLRTFQQSIHTLFGSSFHETFQTYLTVMYTESIKAADALPLHTMLSDNMKAEYKKSLDNGVEHFTTKGQLGEFYTHGIEILDWVKRKRSAYFTNKNWELVGIEVPICHPVSEEHSHIMMIGFLDIVLRNTVTDEIVIIDIKTSTMGWNKYQKADKLKAQQLVLYKEFYAKQFDVNPEKIHIEYFIVKRQLIEGAMFPQKRVQQFRPASGKPTRNKLNRDLFQFIESSFNKDGSYKLDKDYPAVGGKGRKNCRYCEFANNEDLCPKAKRILE